jgi:hypothetical protein
MLLVMFMVKPRGDGDGFPKYKNKLGTESISTSTPANTPFH